MVRSVPAPLTSSEPPSMTMPGWNTGRPYALPTRVRDHVVQVERADTCRPRRCSPSPRSPPRGGRSPCRCTKQGPWSRHQASLVGFSWRIDPLRRQLERTQQSEDLRGHLGARDVDVHFFVGSEVPHHLGEDRPARARTCPARRLRGAATRARCRDVAPTPRACDSPTPRAWGRAAPSSPVDVPLGQIAVGVDPPVAEEGPVGAHHVDERQVALDDQHLFALAGARQHDAVGVGHEAPAPELDPVGSACPSWPTRLTAATNTPLAMAWLRCIVSQAACWPRRTRPSPPAASRWRWGRTGSAPRAAP